MDPPLSGGSPNSSSSNHAFLQHGDYEFLLQKDDAVEKPNRARGAGLQQQQQQQQVRSAPLPRNSGSSFAGGEGKVNLSDEVCHHNKLHALSGSNPTSADSYSSSQQHQQQGPEPQTGLLPSRQSSLSLPHNPALMMVQKV